jgi:hypothetical protein
MAQGAAAVIAADVTAREVIYAVLRVRLLWPLYALLYEKSSLSVFDHKDHAVLEVRYLNSSAARIKGVFRNPKVPTQ